uniref:Uncharacterized protein n=1 Tax=Sipha flava TaxID=143950 RepID=A0A2S2QHX9_9HEMI
MFCDVQTSLRCVRSPCFIPPCPYGGTNVHVYGPPHVPRSNGFAHGTFCGETRDMGPKRSRITWRRHVASILEPFDRVYEITVRLKTVFFPVEIIRPVAAQ